jgi:hypothetical protein
VTECGHPLCELIATSPACSIATGRSRGCTPGLTERTIAPAVFDEVRELLVAIERRDGSTRAAAVRLAEIIRREARDDRQLLAHARIDEPELVPALEALCVRQRGPSATP